LKTNYTLTFVYPSEPFTILTENVEPLNNITIEGPPQIPMNDLVLQKLESPQRFFSFLIFLISFHFSNHFFFLKKISNSTKCKKNTPSPRGQKRKRTQDQSFLQSNMFATLNFNLNPIIEVPLKKQRSSSTSNLNSTSTSNLNSNSTSNSNLINNVHTPPKSQNPFAVYNNNENSSPSPKPRPPNLVLSSIPSRLLPPNSPRLLSSPTSPSHSISNLSTQYSFPSTPQSHFASYFPSNISDCLSFASEELASPITDTQKSYPIVDQYDNVFM